MKKTLTLFSSFLFFFLLSQFCFAQNLVPNYSFEQYDTCPSLGDQIQYATGWSKYSSSNTTPDYYNTCSSSNAQGIPQSFWCYQPEHRNCNAYAGLVTWSSVANYREYTGIQLSQPLTIGQNYFISFITVMGELFDGTYYNSMPTNNIGIRLSTVAFNGSNPCPMNNFAHLYYIPILNDTINWYRVSGSIIADSAYNYLVIGNFFDNINTDTLQYTCSTCVNNLGYYLVDDVCLSTDSLLCNGGIDELQCITGVNEIIFTDGVKIFPNPVSDFVTLLFHNNRNMKIILYDILGKEIFANYISNKNSVNINLSSFHSGTYFLKILNADSNYPIIKKIIKL